MKGCLGAAGGRLNILRIKNALTSQFCVAFAMTAGTSGTHLDIHGSMGDIQLSGDDAPKSRRKR